MCMSDKSFTDYSAYVVLLFIYRLKIILVCWADYWFLKDGAEFMKAISRLEIILLSAIVTIWVIFSTSFCYAAKEFIRIDTDRGGSTLSTKKGLLQLTILCILCWHNQILYYYTKYTDLSAFSFWLSDKIFIWDVY